MTAGAVEDRLILPLCDYSGRWSQPYRDAGYQVQQVDLKRGGDVRLLKKLARAVHGVLCVPVCTEFSGAGAKHVNGCPLQLTEMLTCRLGDLAHDVGGIRNHINCTTGQIEDCFQPRLAV